MALWDFFCVKGKDKKKKYNMANKKFIKIAQIVCFTSCIFLSSCILYVNKDGYVKSFSNFITEVKTNSDKYNAEDWKKADTQYEKFAEQDYIKYRNELTEADKEVIGKLKAKYQLILLKREGADLIEDIKDAIYQVKGAVDELSDTMPKQ